MLPRGQPALPSKNIWRPGFPRGRTGNSPIKWPWARRGLSAPGGPTAVLEKIVHDCLPKKDQPDGLPALVAQFRAYSQQVAEWNWERNADRDRSQGPDGVKGHRQEGNGRVIICIDEMDKIRDSDRAEQFLNNIKAIFDVPGCLYWPTS